jgi:hypothetical protein
MRHFVVCVHDATPAHEVETRVMIRDLARLVGRRLSFAVVPDWNGQWPLGTHPDFCRLVRDSSEELLLHGYFHRRRRGWSPTTFLAEASDEMSGLDPEETRRTIASGQAVFTETFGAPARGFVAPAWQRAHVRLHEQTAPGIEHVLGFFSLESRDGRRVPLTTFTWDCGRWGWLGYIGHGVGCVLRLTAGRVPILAIHPRDLVRGFWPTILTLIRSLLEARYEPSTVAGLLHASEC